MSKQFIAELTEEGDSLKASLDQNNRFIALMCLKCAYKQEDKTKAKDAEIEMLQSLNDFQQQQISCMQSEIEAKDDEIETKDDELDGWKRLNDYYLNQVNARKSDIEKMKCCQNCANSRYTEQGTTCKDDDLECEGLSHWEIRI